MLGPETTCDVAASNQVELGTGGHRDSQAAPVSYEVYKFQLQDRSFITLDGTSVTVASSERMEVLGLEPRRIK